jgi:uncharacterized protein (TIGR00255 family)
MATSMTAYGCIEAEHEMGRITWECRSVNHRYLEINIRLPEGLKMLEAQVRERVASRFKRGKVYCSLCFIGRVSRGQGLAVNMELVEDLMLSVTRIRNLIDESTTLNVLDILRWPDVIEQLPIDLDALSGVLIQQLDRTLDHVAEMRSREGANIAQILFEHCRNMGRLIDGFKDRLPEIQQILRGKLHDRSQALAVQMDQSRLEQEIFLLLQKSDVMEELDRLEMHVTEVQRLLKEDAPMGKRLDFMMQELNREANTLSSKAVDIDYTNTAIDLKMYIEQMREQIQNIE